MSLFENTMKSKLQAYARRNNLPPPQIETIAVRNEPSTFISRVSLNDKVYIGIKCSSPDQAITSAAGLALMCLGAIPPPRQNLSRLFKELKVKYEDLIRYAEAMLVQSRTCLGLILSKNFTHIQQTCEDLVAAISEHREDLVRDLRFVEDKIVAHSRFN